MQRGGGCLRGWLPCLGFFSWAGLLCAPFLLVGGSVAPMFHCYLGYVELLVPGGPKVNVSVLDSKGTAHNMGQSCEYNLTMDLDGTSVFMLAYRRCFHTIINNVFTMRFQVFSYDSYGHSPPTQLTVSCPVPDPKRVLGTEMHLSCSVPSTRQLRCGPPGASWEQCRDAGCCYNSQETESSCFYGKTGCSPGGEFVVVIQKEVVHPFLDLTSLYLREMLSDPLCQPLLSRTRDLAVFHFPLSACGSVAKLEGSDLLYENVVFASRQVLKGQRGSITRDSAFSLAVHCKYTGTHEVGLNASVLTVAPPPPATNRGILQLELRIARDESYSTWFQPQDYPLVKTLRDPLYVEVRALSREDPSIVLLLDDCWATPHADPFAAVFWNLLVQGCPYTEDRPYQTLLHVVSASPDLPFPSHHKRFQVKTFVFLADTAARPPSHEVYIHCSAAICYSSRNETCLQQCPANFPGGKRRRGRASRHGLEEMVVSSGPLTFPMLRRMELDSLGREELRDAGSSVHAASVTQVLGMVVCVLLQHWPAFLLFGKFQQI
ncbi:zona pellucida sperm-binding protein 4-like isoform X2 [Rhinatrema bivittatum]|uniref:zona pellucida sperm-binding protein 4-like isoform X2 n=1 Tax=Rhinatrema bivittatum TaxID=194408 RepID=UPI00112610C0|nr:zona pellucida sperm-binding protein 4-like isoform X2 [Rhinatrema bivittatum]